MSKQYSIAEARKNLPRLLDQVEAGAELELTRRGRPIAVVLSVSELQRLKSERSGFGQAFASFRRRFPIEASELHKAALSGVRYRGAGRQVKL
jgi:prevent-host-death family protein